MIPATTAEVLTRDEIAAWLKVRPRQVERLGVPCIHLGRKTLRYLRADVLAWLESQRPGSGRLRRGAGQVKTAVKTAATAAGGR